MARPKNKGKQEISEIKSITETPKQEKSSNRAAWIVALALGAIIILGLGYSYSSITERNALKKACNDLANLPDLKYPMTCVPLFGDSSGGDHVDQKTSPLCKCRVYYGDGTNQTMDLRVAN